MSRWRLVIGLLSVGLLWPISTLATNGYFSHGYGAKNKGLAGGGIALPQDAMIAATNPAGMVFVGDRMEAGISLFSPMRSYNASTPASTFPDGTSCGSSCPFTVGGEDGNQAINSENEQFLIPHFAYNHPLDNQSTVGITVYGNGGMNTEYQGGEAQYNNGAGTLTTSDGTFGAGTAGVNLEQLFINASFAHKLSENSSWGIGAIYAFQRFEAKGLGTFQGYSVAPTKLTDNGEDDSSGFGFKFGFQAEAAPGITLAASYQTKIDMDEFDKYSGLFADGGDFDIPATLTIGAAWASSDQSVFTFDVQQIYYSDVPSIANPISNLTTGCATGSDTTQCLGGANGAGFGWQDMTIYKLGYQWNSSPDWQWRLGFSTGDQPIPSSEVMFNILAPAVMEEHITFGFTHNMSQTSELNFSAMYAPKASISGANPLNPGQNIELEMSQYELEASWGWKF